jgi:hypothetical protein
MAAALLVLLLAGLWWWMHRPIKPVFLSEPERKVVQEKLEVIQMPVSVQTEAEAPAPAEPKYEAGAREIVFTERELNGLLHSNTGLGDKVKLELATNAVNARIEADLDPQLPIVGGKRLNARARLRFGDDPAAAQLILEDLTVWGVSLPNEWLGGLKGRNLLGEALGTEGGLPGVEKFEVRPGKLSIRLKE